MFGKKLSGIAMAVTLAIGFCGNASAGSANANLTVSASVTANCTIVANALAFGAYDPVSANSATGADRLGEGSVDITCTKSSTSVSIGMGDGLYFSGGRRMRGTVITEFLPYNLYQPGATTPGAACSGTTAWGTTIGTDTLAPTGVSGWGAGSAKNFKVCGVIPKGYDAAVDTFQDTVQATVNF